MKIFLELLAIILLTNCGYEKPDFLNFPLPSPTQSVTLTHVIPTPVITPTTIANNPAYKVTKVLDGDTIEVDFGSKKERVRLIGIDSNEFYPTPQCYAQKAYAKANSLLAGKQVILEADSSQADRDIYNRLLRYVFLEDGTNFNYLMIAEGYAYEYTFITSYKYQQQFREAEESAKKAKKGLWAENACPEPTQVSQTFFCGNKTKCSEMQTCAEARFYINDCGLSRLDGDNDGIPCENICR